MFKTTKTKIAALALVGAVVLGGAIYTTSALAAGGTPAVPAKSAVTSASVVTASAADPQLRATVLEMLKDRMGLTGADAQKFADQMIARTQNVNPNFDLKQMVNWCSQYIGTNTNGSTTGRYCNPKSGAGQAGSGLTGQAGSQAGGSTYGPRGMMGGRGMMGASGLR